MHETAWKPPERFRQNKHFTGGNMTKIEFKEAMFRGLGRCVIAVRQAPEKYRKAVLWACQRDIAYDAQCEGTRAWYVYTMVNCYSDREPFIRAAAEALHKYRPKGGWDLLHLSELLMCFASDGCEFARQAVEDKYQEMLAVMFGRKGRPNRVFYELSDLEQLGLVLATDRRSFLRIAADFGRLYREKPYMDDGDFAWFFSSKGGQYRKTMERAAQKHGDIACFMQREQAYLAAQENNREQRKTAASVRLEGFFLSGWLAKNADRETVEQYAASYREQTQPELRAEALEAFSRCPYPGDPQMIIEDTKSECKKLQKAAWQALENLRHPAVRKFALDNAYKGIRTPENFALLMTNYMPEDAKLLEELLWQTVAAKDWDAVHAAGMDVKGAFRKGSSIPHPKHLLPILYEYNPCSFCREGILADMSKHRMLTEEILEECRFDSSYEIRRFAEKRLKE